MILWGHNFLRSNWLGGDPLHAIANAKQMRTLANIPKYIQGIGCRILKDTTAEGKNWRIVVDGTSDVTPPDNYVYPWAPQAAASLSATTGLPTSGNGTIAFNTIDHRTNQDVVYLADLAGGPPAVQNTITIKEGYSGLYDFTIQAQAAARLEPGEWSDVQLKVSRDGTDLACVWMLAVDQSLVGEATGDTIFENAYSATERFYINASAADVDITVKYYITGTSSTISINNVEFNVALYQLASASGA